MVYSKFNFLLNLFFNQKPSNFFFVCLFVWGFFGVCFWFFFFCAVFHTANLKEYISCYRYSWVCLWTTEWLKGHLKTLLSPDFQSFYDILAWTWACSDPQPDDEIQSMLMFYHLEVCTSAGINRKKLILYFECSEFYFGTDSIWSLRTNIKLLQKQPLPQKCYFRLECSHFVLF